MCRGAAERGGGLGCDSERLCSSLPRAKLHVCAILNSALSITFTSIRSALNGGSRHAWRQA